MKTRCQDCPKSYNPSCFLMMHDHPSYYYMMGVEPNDIEISLRDPAHTSMEKRLAIFAMQELGETAYSQLMESVYDFYDWDQVSLHLMEELLHCSFPNFCKYPFLC